MFVKIVGPSPTMGVVLSQQKLCDLWLWFKSVEDMITFVVEDEKPLPGVTIYHDVPFEAVKTAITMLRLFETENELPLSHSVWITDDPIRADYHGFDVPTITSHPLDFPHDAALIFSLLEEMPRRVHSVQAIRSLTPRGRK